MNNKKYIAILVSVLCLASGCEGNFDPKIYGSFVQSVYPSTADDYNSLAVSCYGPFLSFWNTTMGGRTVNCWYGPACGLMKVFEMPTDLNAPWKTGGSSSWLWWGQADFSEAEDYSRSYSDSNCSHFQGVSDVTRMTKIIQTISNADPAVLSDAKKSKLLGEVHLTRGLEMYLLLNKYGPLPFVTDPDKVKDNEELYNMARPSLDEVSKKIYDDFEYAIEHIGTYEEVTEKGRYNKDYARVCMMRHCLNEGYHMEGYYQKAIDMYNELKAEGHYALYTSGSNPYAEQFTSAHKFNCEVIMAISVNPNSTGAAFGNYNATCLYMYPNNAEMTADANPEFGIGNTWSQYYNISPYFYDSFEANDMRRKCIVTSYVTKTGTTITSDNLGSSWDGYIMNKFKPESKKNYQGMDIPLARWADVLLMYAEAETRKDKTVSADAIEAVNEVRARAGLAGLGTDKTSSEEAFLNAILDERGHELYYECMRKIDLIRFNVFAQKNYAAKGIVPKSQYVPVPDYAVEQAKENGVTLEQYWQRDEYPQDLAKINK